MKISKYRIMQIINESYQTLIKESYKSYTTRDLKNRLRSMIFDKNEEYFNVASAVIESYALGGIEDNKKCLRILTGFIEDLRKLIAAKTKSLYNFQKRTKDSSIFSGQRNTEAESELAARSIELKGLVSKRNALIKIKKELEDLLIDQTKKQSLE